MSTPREFHGWAAPTGHIQWDSPAVVTAYCRHLAGPDGHEVTAQLYRRRAKRSLRANAYWHGVVIPTIAGELGYTHDELHEALKAKFLSREDLEHGLIRIRSSAKLSAEEFGTLIETVTIWAAETLGILIPQPVSAPHTIDRAGRPPRRSEAGDRSAEEAGPVRGQ